MDESTGREILDRLERLETKVDTMVTFTTMLQSLVRVWMTGGRGKMLTALARIKGGEG